MRIALAGALLVLGACTRSRPEHEPPPPQVPTGESLRSHSASRQDGSVSQAALPTPDDGRRDGGPEAGDGKRGFLTRIFNNASAAPQYVWDGQFSSATTKTPLPTAHGRAIDTLRRLGFSIRTEESRRQDKIAHAAGERPDHTTALIVLEEKSPGLTSIKVRVGQLGDRSSSERILEELQHPPSSRPAARSSGK